MRFVPKNSLGGADSDQRNPTEAVHVTVLPGEQQIGDFCRNRQVGRRDVVAVFGKAVHRAFLHPVPVAYGQRGRTIILLYAVSQNPEEISPKSQ